MFELLARASGFRIRGVRHDQFGQAGLLGFLDKKTTNFTEELRQLPSLDSELLPLLSSEEKSLESRLERFEACLESWLESELEELELGMFTA